MNRIQVGKPVKGNQLIGREKELSTISALLQNGQSVVVVAPRRFGKTSLTFEILNRLKEQDYYTAYVDFFLTPDINSLSRKITEEVLNNRKLGKLFKKITGNITEMFRNVELKQTIENFEFILKYNTPNTDAWELFSESIDFINNYPKKYGKQMICAFDEFGDINKFDGDHIVKLIRSKIQMQDNATYIFSGSYASVMESLFVQQNSPFFRFARIVHLGYIGKGDFKKYISGLFKKENIDYDDGFIDQILDFTKGHPYYTQLILQQILLNNSTGIKPCDISLREILQQLLVIENNYLEKQWEDISKSREIVQTLLAVVRYGKSLYSHVDTKKVNMGRALKKLSGAGVIFKNTENGGFFLSDPLFELWINEKIIGE
jgi:AAA+ ATPase superfamily predicted ATPase